MASFFSMTVDGVTLRRGGLFGGVVVVMDFLDPRLTGGAGGVFCICFLEFRLEGGNGGGTSAPPGGWVELRELRCGGGRGGPEELPTLIRDFLSGECDGTGGGVCSEVAPMVI